jgi:hypothetical protein
MRLSGPFHLWVSPMHGTQDFDCISSHDMLLIMFGFLETS